jgi:MFS family permease
VDGLRFLVTKPVLLLSFAVDIIAMVFAMPRALFPEVAQHRFGGGAAVGWLFSAIALGSVVGGLTSGWIGRVRRQGVALVLAVVCWGVAVGLAGLAPSLWLMVLLLAVGGAADLVSAVYRQSILQTYAPDRLRGRLQGVFTVVVAGGPRLGDLRAGATAELTGATASWVGGGFLAAGLAVVLATVFPALLRYRPPRDASVTG